MSRGPNRDPFYRKLDEAERAESARRVCGIRPVEETPPMPAVKSPKEEASEEVGKLRASLEEMLTAMERYEMDVDEEPPHAHRAMMDRAREALGKETT